MVNYTVYFTAQGENDLERLDKEIAQRVLEKLKYLIVNFDSIRHISLKGKYSGNFKLKVGYWRIIYSVDYNLRTLTVNRIGHRKDIYNC
ncbi:addiction module toxin, RelE/StbE family protein [Candidatus Magnetoovum chiemensis]|nr:addiction module toxin, RelE/StbE family protein [Candidatus Magnetoovum chiemensis]